MKENIIINYLLLEQILRITGTYKTVCDEFTNSYGIYTTKNKKFDVDKYEKDKEKFEIDKERYKEDKEKYIEITERYNEEEANNRKYILHKFNILEELFKRSRDGEIDSLFQDNNAKGVIIKRIEELTGVSAKYWSGENRIKLRIRLSDLDLSYDEESIDNAKIGAKTEKEFYDEHLNNPLHLDYEEFYTNITGVQIETDTVKEDEAMDADTITSLFSLKGLITVLLINMEEASIVELIDKANIYKHSRWEPYMKKSSKPTKEDIMYCPKHVEIRGVLVQTIIKNLLNLGYVFTFRDLEKEFSI